ncbi:hypothetical protein HUN39_15075 [Methylocystis sp. FS]|uniref:hypothetical protein n=1 Tax=Methylocystis silviterrae TaxID=2743612 RepID=UPI0015825BAB|nr:hypothetical protein [Methylocystis silviterrae]NUJ81325.1 hypothetical protein [Methylocystis silviterrae]
MAVPKQLVTPDGLLKAAVILLVVLALLLVMASGAVKIPTSLWANADDPCLGYAICE